MKQKVALILILVSLIMTACGNAAGSLSGNQSVSSNINISSNEAVSVNDVTEKNRCEEAGHEFESATCTSPEKCRICGITNGQPLEHQCNIRTVSEAKVCKICGTVIEEPIKVTVCKPSLSEEEYVVFGDDGYVVYNHYTSTDIMHFTKYRFDNTIEKVYDYCYDETSTFYSAWPVFINGKFYAVTHGIKDQSPSNNNAVYSFDGELYWNSDKYSDAYAATMKNINNENYAVLYKHNKTKPYKYVNIDTNEEVKKLPSANESEDKNWSYFKECSGGEYYFVATQGKKTKWGFLDKDRNELAMFEDVSNFTESGYALASDDKKNYYIIDKEFNRVSESVYEGNSASLIYEGTNVITLYNKKNDSYYALIIE